MKKILVTGFEPFNNQLINPSLEAIKKLKSTLYGAEIHVLAVPTVFRESIEIVKNKLHILKPDVVLLIGQAGDRKGISIERVALNIDDASIPDNRGIKPINKSIIPNGPNALFSTLPIHQMVDHLNLNKIPAFISNTAGTYVCNHLMYGVLHEISNLDSPVKAGFIHVPYMHEQVTDSSHYSMSLEDIVKSISLCIEVMMKESI